VALESTFSNPRKLVLGVDRSRNGPLVFLPVGYELAILIALGLPSGIDEERNVRASHGYDLLDQCSGADSGKFRISSVNT
jgi:hypothetical protein